MKISINKMLIFVTVALITLQGCSQPVSLVSQDVSGFAWSHGEVLHEGPGFFAHPDGRLMPLSHSSWQGDSWQVADNRLIIHDKTSPASDQAMVRYLPQRSNNELTLVREGRKGQSAYHRLERGHLFSDVQYRPITVMGDRIADFTGMKQKPYLQFDAEEGVVRGFGGVNNFRGGFQMTEGFNIEFGPMMATRMAGPGMDAEIKLFQCLDQADTVLTIEHGLFLYEDSRILCSFSRK